MSFETVAQEIVFDALTARLALPVLAGAVWVDTNNWDDDAFWLEWSPISAAVYDEVPYLPEGMPRQNFPYAVIGDDTTTPWDTDDTLGKEVSITVHVWSRTAGFKETKAILGEVYDILNRGNLFKTGYNVVDCLCDFSETMRDPDGKTRHGVMRFKLTIQKE